MANLEGSLEIYLTNLGKYNEGRLVGEWVKLPISAEEMKAVLERIQIGTEDSFGNVYEEMFITDYDCSIYGVSKLLGEYENLDKLNYFAGRYEEMPLHDQERFTAIMESGCDEVSDIDDLINLTYNLDRYDILPDVKDDSDLGYYWVHESGAYDIKSLGALANYIDYDRFGSEIQHDEGGTFTDYGYVRSNGESWNHYFNGELDDIPDEYRLTRLDEESQEAETIRAVVVEPGKPAVIQEIESGLAGLQAFVGGDIEAVYPYEDPVAIICNEEGKLIGLEMNRVLRDDEGKPYDILCGKFAVVGLAPERFASLSDELAEKYAKQFKNPELFINVGGKIVVNQISVEEAPTKETKPKKKEEVEVNMNTDGLNVKGHIGTWHTIEQKEIDGHMFFMMEHDTFGDDAANVIVDAKGNLVLDDIYNGFDDETVALIHEQLLPVEKMPDESISMEDMNNYGYHWGGMLPVRNEVAKQLMPTYTVYKLYADSTERLASSFADIEAHAHKEGIFGIPKDEWIGFQEFEIDNALKNAEVSTEDDYGMIDGIINNGKKESAEKPVEKASIRERLKAGSAEAPKENPIPQKERKGDHEL